VRAGSSHLNEVAVPQFPRLESSQIIRLIAASTSCLPTASCSLLISAFRYVSDGCRGTNTLMAEVLCRLDSLPLQAWSLLAVGLAPPVFQSAFAATIAMHDSLCANRWENHPSFAPFCRHHSDPV
jgi:hypothetical protein